MSTRRRFLQASGVGLATGLAGCAVGFDPRPELDLVVANYREAAVPVEIAVLPPDADDGSDARVFHERAVIPRVAGEEDLWRRESFARARHYRIELVVRETWTAYQHHYRPSCTRGEVDAIGVRVNIDEGGSVRFTQSDCSNGGRFG